MPSFGLPEVAGIADVGELSLALRTLLTRSGGPELRIDCSAVRIVDAATLQCLLAARRAASAAGVSLRLVEPSEDFRRYAGYCGLSAQLLGD